MKALLLLGLLFVGSATGKKGTDFGKQDPKLYPQILSATWVRTTLLSADTTFARCDKEDWPLDDQECLDEAAAVGIRMMVDAKKAAQK